MDLKNRKTADNIKIKRNKKRRALRGKRSECK